MSNYEVLVHLNSILISIKNVDSEQSAIEMAKQKLSNKFQDMLDSDNTFEFEVTQVRFL
jgi:hypothetical protein